MTVANSAFFLLRPLAVADRRHNRLMPERLTVSIA